VIFTAELALGRWWPAGRSEVCVPRITLALLLCCAPLCAVAGEPRAVDVARVNSDQAKQVEIVSQTLSADGSQLEMVFRPLDRRFSVDFDLIGRDPDWVRITIQGVRKWDVLRYQADPQRRLASIDLTKLPGVRITTVEKSIVIDLATPHAAHILAPEGRFLFKEGYESIKGEEKK
jgi:hypothetical protein